MPRLVESLSDRVYARLREQIVAGDRSAQSPVRQDAVASDLGVSKIPVREALSRLAQDGLVVRLPNRGWFVRPLSMAEAEEVYALRLALEPQAAARACRVAQAPERACVEAAYTRLLAARDLTLSVTAVRNREFHLALVDETDRPLTRQLLERLALLAERYVVQHLRPAGRNDRARHEHAALLRAWLGGDATAVATQLQAHLEGTLADLRRQLSH
ncbi:MAG: GntR family transcriptional regulator [Pseudomonadota bacterium]